MRELAEILEKPESGSHTLAPFDKPFQCIRCEPGFARPGRGVQDRPPALDSQRFQLDDQPSRESGGQSPRQVSHAGRTGTGRNHDRFSSSDTMIDRLAGRIGGSAGQVLDVFDDEKVAGFQTDIGEPFVATRSRKLTSRDGSSGDATSIAGDNIQCLGGQECLSRSGRPMQNQWAE
jgi:hypothetical protein